MGMTQEQVDQFVQSSLGTFLASDDSSYVNGIELFVDRSLAQFKGCGSRFRIQSVLRGG